MFPNTLNRQDEAQNTLRKYLANIHFTSSSLSLPSLKFETLQVECDALGSPEPIVKWFKNGEPLRKSGLLLLDPAAKDNKVKAEDESKLSLPITSVSDAGDYSCKAANLVGETHSLQFSLEVQQQQQYANNKNNLQKHGGENVDLASLFTDQNYLPNSELTLTTCFTF